MYKVNTSLITIITFSTLMLVVGSALMTVDTRQANAVDVNDTTIHSTHSSKEVTPIAAIIFINEDKNQNIVFVPSNVTINVGEEILILNNATSDQSVTNGAGPDDQFSGKFFDTELIKPGKFVEYAAHNLSPGEYTYYSKASPQSIGKIIVN